MFDKNSREIEIKIASKIAIEIANILAEKELKFSTAKLSLEFAKECLEEYKMKKLDN